RWVALWLFVSANWVHQDYLSPQAEAYFLYLVVIASVLRYFSSREHAWAAPSSRFVPSFASRPITWVQRFSGDDAASCVAEADADADADAGSPFLLRSIVVVVATVVVSHQITPFAILLVVGALVVT